MSSYQDGQKAGNALVAETFGPLRQWRSTYARGILKLRKANVADIPCRPQGTPYCYRIFFAMYPECDGDYAVAREFLAGWFGERRCVPGRHFMRGFVRAILTADIPMEAISA